MDEDAPRPSGDPEALRALAAEVRLMAEKRESACSTLVQEAFRLEFVAPAGDRFRLEMIDWHNEETRLRSALVDCSDRLLQLASRVQAEQESWETRLLRF